MNNLDGQMDIFDFLGKKPGTGAGTKHPDKTLFGQIFERVDNPVVKCANCLCQYCANNAEEIWDKARPGEMQDPCFNCDGCREYTGETGDRYQAKEGCSSFLISDYGAKRNRKKFFVKKRRKANETD